MGIAPLWGFQMAVALALAFLFRLNKPLVIISSNISITPMIPPILFLSYQCGKWWMGDKALEIPFSTDISIEVIHQNFIQYLYGSLTLGTMAGILAGFITFGILKGLHRKRKKQETNPET